MGNAAGEVAHRLHARGLGELRLQAPPLGDVEGGDQAGLVPQEADVVGGYLDLQERPVVAPQPPQAGRPEGVARLGDVRLQGRHILGRANVAQRHRQELFTRVAVRRDRGIVDRQVAQRLHVEDPHRNGVAVEEVAEATLGFA